MTWTKLGDEYSDEARDLSDTAFRTHTEALLWSNRRQLDLVIPKRDLRRFAETGTPDAAVEELLDAGWWEDRGDAWWVGIRHPDWQLESKVVQKRKDSGALRVRRHRLHGAGDHSICLPENCTAAPSTTTGNALPAASRNALPGTGRDGTGLQVLPGVNQDLIGEGEGGVGGDPRPFPSQCSRHQDGPNDAPCRACGTARVAHEAAAAARAREDADRPREICTAPGHEFAVVNSHGCSACRSEALEAS